MWMREVIGITKPKIFIAENVKGLTKPQRCQRNYRKRFLPQYVTVGTLVVPARVLLAADYGVPQSRERVIFYGFKKSELKPDALAALSRTIIDAEYDPYPIPTHCEKPGNTNQLRPFVTLRTAFVELNEPKVAIDIDQKKYSQAKVYGKTLPRSNRSKFGWNWPDNSL